MARCVVVGLWCGRSRGAGRCSAGRDRPVILVGIRAVTAGAARTRPTVPGFDATALDPDKALRSTD